MSRIYRQAHCRAHQALLHHTFTITLANGQLQHWQDWAKRMVTQFHRASSAVEGRNGYLSQRHHVQRGFWQNHLPVLTVIHNFDLKRSDGTTAAQRLFGRQFGCVAKSEGDGRVGKLHCYRLASHVYSPSI